MPDQNLYQEIIIDESQNPENFGVLDDSDFTATDGNASCGDTITVYINLTEDQKVIKDIKWQGEGCAISKASMSLLSQEISGKTVQEVMSMSQDNLLKLIGLDSISSGRIKCLMVGLSVVQKALEKDLENKTNKN